jgi:cytochrome c peroxidase
MFDNTVHPDPHAWWKAVERVRGNESYKKAFGEVFGTRPTRDGIVKAIAAYERTVLQANSFHDRADVVARVERLQKLAEEGKPANPAAPVTAADYETVLKAALDGKKDADLLAYLGVKDAAGAAAAAKSLANGRELFFGKARCNSCHAGDNYTDNLFHNLGVGAKEGQLEKGQEGRFEKLGFGHKNPELLGAFKTPSARNLRDTFPYMHSGAEKTLEDVVKFYDKGGNVNPYLDPKMRDVEAEKEFQAMGKDAAEQFKKKYPAKEFRVYGGKVIIPLKLNLTEQEQKDLVLFLKALQGEAMDPIVADPKAFPSGAAPAPTKS